MFASHTQQFNHERLSKLQGAMATLSLHWGANYTDKGWTVLLLCKEFIDSQQKINHICDSRLFVMTHYTLNVFFLIFCGLLLLLNLKDALSWKYFFKIKIQSFFYCLNVWYVDSPFLWSFVIVLIFSVLTVRNNITQFYTDYDFHKYDLQKRKARNTTRDLVNSMTSDWTKTLGIKTFAWHWILLTFFSYL